MIDELPRYETPRDDPGTPIFFDRQNRVWGFWDECWCNEYTGYKTRELAEDALSVYELTL